MEILTDSAIDAMPAGWPLNQLICRRVMGREVTAGMMYVGEKENPETERREPFFVEVPDYSGDIGRAWEVVDRMSQVTLTMKIGKWECECFDGVGGSRSTAESAPLAICRAALKYAMVQEALNDVYL